VIEIAVMIPITDKAARGLLYPPHWAPPPTVWWPEVGKANRPRLPAEVADYVQSEITEAMPKWKQLAIVTRSEMVQLRVRRMIAEGKPIAASIYLVIGEGATECFGVKPDGELTGWRDGLFSEDFAEVKAIRRAQDASRADKLSRGKKP
jgi:hypothetical protein